MATDAARTTTVTATPTFVPFPAEPDFVKVDVYDAAGVVILWVDLDSSRGASGTVAADNMERIKPNGSALIPWGRQTVAGVLTPGRYMVTEAGSCSVNVVTAKGRI